MKVTVFSIEQAHMCKVPLPWEEVPMLGPRPKCDIIHLTSKHFITTHLSAEGNPRFWGTKLFSSDKYHGS